MQQDPANREAVTKRTLQSLSSDLEEFRADGRNIIRAKLYNNIIDEYLFNVPIDQVCSFPSFPFHKTSSQHCLISFHSLFKPYL